MPGPVRGLCAALVAVIAVVLFLATPAGAAGSSHFTPVADTFVTAAQPDASYGTQWGNARVDDNPRRIGYFKFHVSDIPAGAPINSATLTLTGVAAQTAQVVDLHLVGNNWTETTTYNSRPALGARIDTQLVGSGASATFTVPVSGNGTVSFAVVRTTTGGDNVIATRENVTASKRPELVVHYGETTGDAPDTDGIADETPPSDSPTAAPTTEDTAAAPATSSPATTSPATETTTPTTDGGAGDGTSDSSTSASGTPATTEDATTPSGTPSPPPPSSGASHNPFIAYDADSFFRRTLPADAPTAADSERGIALHTNQEPRPYPRINGVGSNAWGTPYALGTCSDPVWTLSGGTVPAHLDWLRTEGFHAPAGWTADLTGTSDSPLVVIDRCGNGHMPEGFSVWAWGASAHSGNVVAVGHAGVFQHDSNGLDRRNPQSDSTLNARSRGAIPDAMVIRDDLLHAAMNGANGGTLGHVLHMFAMETDSAAGFAHPMTGYEKDKSGYGAEGQRLRVKASWTPPAGCTGPGLVLARTLQHYGAYLGDNSGSGSTLKAQQGTTFPGLTEDALAPCVTWDDMEYLSPGWDG
ncbi:CBM96 family carbohydrate-binding protein [Geodermatophilus marinus]|uniref:CBM96 family carbohydrate-binding protein n=1 Tax=Geodermatophilus sp. LHW52908 TaxID=2303986 RepID=UPI000E3D7840|nr:DNRLRE domain-containing protein [Geodermatophilus sp. LHW52908]RFU18785.1 hypothetical protein D0Z06_24850 [Geodermatophilus sp. LHW52908]